MIQKLKNTFVSFIKDEEAQGAVEYILLLVVVVAVATIFREQIETAVTDKISQLQGSISSFGN